MDKLLTLYYCFKEFENKVNKNDELKAIYEELSRNINDNLVIKKTNVEIKTDWIKFLNDNLIYIDNAIEQNRQFIREDGEVLPVYRVKKINKATIADLSKHSDYIDKIDQDNNVTPSKLLTVNKDTDYAIYENRFLYFLLVTIKGFVTEKISDVERALSMGRSILTVKRFDNFLDSNNHIEMIYTSKRNKEKEVLSNESIELKNKAMDLLERVNGLLNTSLMKLMARESIITGEITKTNVLRMDEDFKHCLEIYEFILGYDRDGHIVNETVTNKMAPDLRQAIIITELLTYVNEYSLGDEYDKSYLSYEDTLRQERIDSLVESLKDKNQKDYIIDLEDLVESLKEKSGRFEDVKNQFEALTATYKSVLDDNKNLKNDLAKLRVEFEKLNADSIAKINLYLSENKKLNEELLALKDEQNKKELILNRTAERNAALKTENEMLLKDNNDLMDQNRSLKEDLDKAKADYDLQVQKINEDLMLTKSIITASEAMNNTLNGDYTSKEAFDNLELQYEAFKKFFEAKWKETKKKIKQNMKGE